MVSGSMLGRGAAVVVVCFGDGGVAPAAHLTWCWRPPGNAAYHGGGLSDILPLSGAFVGGLVGPINVRRRKWRGSSRTQEQSAYEAEQPHWVLFILSQTNT